MALHSLGVGIGMILLPIDWIAYFDIIPSKHRFFITQGGVFHILMAVAYYIAALDIDNNRGLIIFSIIVKFSATLFLFSYFVFINHFLIVLGSGFADLAMGLAVFIFYFKYRFRNSS
jgi:hypothetical protein